ncbi:hypothetical protein PRIPAC_79570 [Pristionchus pacificus]|uniref:Uncharacterized protein n=1 Tax=Pristionchus pacificus TaxID=54126 RepID=A0A2A6C4G4_PRIPA|nr:hypothetical protein PRIPAC_79570 [Pristionchus pacificus]|eukprot:PDM72997.1 hypothetical protein PRIPAC_39431 [Pristionchus pacificus]
MSIAYAIGCAIGQALFPITDEKLMAAAKKGEEKRRLKAEKKNRKETKPEDLPAELRVFDFSLGSSNDSITTKL